MNYIESIFKKLDLDRGNLYKSDLSHVFSKKIYETIQKKFNLYAVFCLSENPAILFFNNPEVGCEKDLHKWIWNYNQSAIAIIVKGNNVTIYNAFSFNKDNQLLNVLGHSEQLFSNFNYLQLVTGETWEIYKDKLLAQNKVLSY